MKALTICQPYAHLIVVAKEKRVENRSWRTDYRGPLLIHAGMNRGWLHKADMPIVETFVPSNTGKGKKRISTADLHGREIHFGAIIGKADVVECAHIDDIRAGVYDLRFPWLKEHPHTEGEFCLVLDDVVQFERPIPLRGQLGLFNVPFDEQTGVCSACGCTWTRACRGGCHWVAPNLCSSCVEADHG